MNRGKSMHNYRRDPSALAQLNANAVQDTAVTGLGRSQNGKIRIMSGESTENSFNNKDAFYYNSNPEDNNSFNASSQQYHYRIPRKEAKAQQVEK